MDKLIKKLDEIFEKYGVEQAEIEEVGNLLQEAVGGELNTEGEDFETPDMGEKDGEDEYEEDED